MQYRLALALLFVVVLTGCGGTPTPASQSSGAGDITPVFAFSEAVVGPNRMPIGLLRGGAPINDPAAKVHLRFYDLGDGNAQVKSEADATYYGQGLPAAVYVAYPTFDKAGDWGVEVQTTLAGQAQPSIRRLRLQVLPKSAVPNVGDRAIPTKTLTVGDVPDPKQLTSDGKPDLALYQVSLDAALQSGKPTVLYFGTPAFCRTAVCGPGLQALQGLQKTYGDRANFIHVEVYKYPFQDSFETINQAAEAASKANRALTLDEFKQGFSDPMVAWNLATEPWLYLVDATGTIAARYEGGITTDEIGPAIEQLIAGKPITSGR